MVLIPAEWTPWSFSLTPTSTDLCILCTLSLEYLNNLFLFTCGNTYVHACGKDYDYLCTCCIHPFCPQPDGGHPTAHGVWCSVRTVIPALPQYNSQVSPSLMLWSCGAAMSANWNVMYNSVHSHLECYLNAMPCMSLSLCKMTYFIWENKPVTHSATHWVVLVIAPPV